MNGNLVKQIAWLWVYIGAYERQFATTRFESRFQAVSIPAVFAGERPRQTCLCGSGPWRIPQELCQLHPRHCPAKSSSVGRIGSSGSPGQRFDGILSLPVPSVYLKKVKRRHSEESPLNAETRDSPPFQARSRSATFALG